MDLAKRMGGEAFAATLGRPRDFAEESFVRMLINAIHWATGKPAAWTGRGGFDLGSPAAQLTQARRVIARPTQVIVGDLDLVVDPNRCTDTVNPT